MQIRMEVKLPASVKKAGKYFISCCPILDVCSQGETKKKALKNLGEAVSLFLASCFERSTLDKVLKSCGFISAKSFTIKPKPFPSRFESIDVPIPFWIKHKKDYNECHG